MYELMVRSSFDAAHNLRGYEGACEHLHGHTYRVEVFYQGNELNDLGMLVDFRRLKTVVNEVIDELDHRYLNECADFEEVNPTAENIAKSIFAKLRSSLGDGISKVTVWETDTSAASYWE